MLDQAVNFAKVTVLTGYSAAATTIDLAAGQGAKLPAASSGAYNLVWWNVTDYPDPADDPNVEIVRVTHGGGADGDVLTVTRAQEGTTATQKQSANKIYKMQLGVTAKMIADISTSVGGSLKFIQITGSIPGTSFATASVFTGKSVIVQGNTFFFQDVDYTYDGVNSITWLYSLTAPFTSSLTLICVG